MVTQHDYIAEQALLHGVTWDEMDQRIRALPKDVRAPTHFPCGCITDTQESPTGRIFVFQPCSPDCYITQCVAELHQTEYPEMDVSVMVDPLDE